MNELPFALIGIVLAALVALVLVLEFEPGKLLGEFAFAIGGLNYNPGGLVVPVGYHVPTTPYLPPAASQTSGVWRFISGTAASYNGLNMTLLRQNADGSATSIQFQYYNTGGGPALPIIGIDVTGMTTAAQIRGITATQLAAQGFLVTLLTGANMRVTQPVAGDAGDVGYLGDFSGLGLFVIGPDIPRGDDVFALYGQTIFFGGYELSVPLRIGRIYGMAPVAEPFTGETA
jgi:hypothetical protein